MSTREDAHRLVDELPAERLDDVVRVLRGWSTSPEIGELLDGEPVVRKFRTTAIFEGEPDLGSRVKDILRSELGVTRGHRSA